MGELTTETLSKLLDTLGAQARSNTELAVEVRAQGEKVEAATTEIRNLAASVDKNTSAVNKLVHCQQAEERHKDQRRSLWRRVGMGAWEVAKSPVGFLLLAAAGWIAVTWLGWNPAEGPLATP